MTAPRLVSRDEINDARWNELIEISEQQVIYGYSWYLDTACNHWMALVWPSLDEYKIVMPLPIRRKWLIKVIQQPLFCQYLGLFSVHQLSQDEIKKFLASLSQYFRYISSYHFHPSNTAVLSTSLSSSFNFQIRENTTFWLSLSDSYENIKKCYSSDKKANLRRSLVESWNVTKSEDLEPLINLFKENHAAKIIGGVDNKAYAILKSLFEKMSRYESAELFYATKDDIVHAGILIARSGNKIIYLFNAADKKGRDGNARTYLLDKFFEKNSDNTVVFDFESPEINAIASFYKSFGAEPKTYFTIRKNNLPFPIRQIQAWRLKRLI